MKLALKTTAILFLLVLAILVQVSDPVAQGLAASTRPFLKGVSTIADGIGYFTGFLPVGSTGQRELQQLKEENASLKLQVQRQQVFRAQNRGLRQLLNLRDAPDWHRQHAAIIARDPVAWEQKFRINKGREDGIVLGAAVLERQYLVGRVVSVATHSATVATLANRDCRISVQLGKSRAVGILGGRHGTRHKGQPVCLITYLPREKDYRTEELVVTSGLSRVIPGGLPVGKTIVWDHNARVNVRAGTYAKAKYIPDASFDNFRFVTVLSKRAPPTDGNTEMD